MNPPPDRDDRIDFSDADARDWHYAFAHRSLRDVVFEQTEKLLDGLSDPERIARVPAAIMRRVAQDIDQPEEALADHAEAIRVGRHSIGMLPVYVFEMPRPLAPVEAHLVGVVNAFTSHPQMLYFTLERRAGGGTALCRWDAAGNHLDLGDGPPPTIEGFVATIAAQLDDMGVSVAERIAPSGVPPAPADAAAAPSAAWIDRESVNADVLAELLGRAVFDFELEATGRFAIRDLGIHYFLILPKLRRDYLTLCAWWTLLPDDDRRTRFDAVNRINNEYLFIRAAIEDETYLCLSQNIPVLCGISAKYLVAVLRNYANACREAIGEHGAVLIGV